MFQFYAGNFNQPLKNWNVSSDADTIDIFDYSGCPGEAILLLQLKTNPFLHPAHCYLPCYLFLRNLIYFDLHVVLRKMY
jgi:hypothetical protein